MSSTLTLQDIGLGNTSISTFIYQMPVKSIDVECFKDNENLTSIELLSVEDPLPAELFSGCSKLCAITLPGQDTYSQNIFGSSVSKRPASLLSVKLSEGTRDIGNALSGLPALEVIDFPDSLQVLRKNSFAGDASLKTLQFKRNVQVDDEAFAGVASLEQLVFPLRSESKNLGLQELTNLVNLSLLWPVSGSYGIAPSLLSSCSFRDIVIEGDGAGLSSIGERAFEDSQHFKILNISSSTVNTLKARSFAGCTTLQQLRLNSEHLRKIEEDALAGAAGVKVFGCKNLTSIGYPGAPVSYMDQFAENTISIGISAFANASFINSAVSLKPTFIGNSAFSATTLSSAILDLYSTKDQSGNLKKAIPDSCFSDCIQLSTVQVKSCTGVGREAFARSGIYSFNADSVGLVAEESAFCECTMLQQLDLAKFSCIKEHALAGCPSYQIDINALQNLTAVGDYAFDGSIVCSQLSAPPSFISASIGTKVFNGCRVNKLLAEDTTVAQLNEHLSAKVGGGSLIPTSPDPVQVREVYLRLKAFFGFANDFELQLKDYVFNKDGSGNDYACIIMEEKEDGWHIRGFDPSAKDAKAFIANPVIPSKAKWIDDSAFTSQDDLTSIQLNNVEHIGKNAFYGCSNLKQVSVAPSLTAVGNEAFMSCTKLTSFDFSSLKVAGELAFRFCISLPELDLPKMIDIGFGAFSDCSSVTAVSMPSVSDMDQSAFANDLALEDVEFGLAPLTYLPAHAFLSCPKVDMLKLNDNLVDLRDDSLAQMESLSVQFIGRTVEHIDPILDLDNSCSSLPGTKFFTKDNDYKYPMYITKTAAQIMKNPNKAFNIELQGTEMKLIGVDDAYLNPLGNVAIQSSEFVGLKVANGAFAGTKLVKTVNLAVELTSNIEAGAFSDAEGLVAVLVNDTYDSTHGDTRKDTFISWVGTASDTKIYFDNGHLQRKDGTADWGFVVTAEMFIPDPADSSILIGINDKYIPIGERDATLSSHFKKIASGALSSTVVLTGFTTNVDLEEIAPSAFYDNTSLEDVYIRSTCLTSIGKNAFARSAIKQINIPGTIKQAAGYGLNKNYQLRHLTYNEGVEEILPSAMVNCAAMLSSLDLPVSLERVGDYAFAELNSFFPYLVDVQFGKLAHLTAVGDYAFYNSVRGSTTGKLALPANLLSVGAAAFGYAEDAWTQDISSLELTADAPVYLNGRNVEDIGPSAFIHNHLREIRFNKQGLSSIGDYAFAYPKYKCTMQIPKSIRKIGTNAFKKNVILNPEKVEKNIISIALDNVGEVLDVIHSLSSPDFTAQNTIGVTDHTCLVANGDGSVEGSNYIYAFDKKLHFSPDNMYINIYKKSLTSADGSITSALVPPYINEISAGAFQNCTGLLSAVIPNRSSAIGPSAFYRCSKLIYVNGPSDFCLSVVEPYTFAGCKKLENIKLLSSTLYVGEKAFYDCDAAASFQTIDPEELKNYYLSAIGPSAFAECDLLSSFFIPRSILSLDSTAFASCKSLKNINIDLTGEDFRDIVANEICSVGEVVKIQFGNITPANDCRISFNDSVYMNDGTVKIDSEFVRMRKVAGVLSAVSATDYMLLDSEHQFYLNLSCITDVDPFVFRGLSDLQTVNFLPCSTGYLSSIGDYAFSKCGSLIRVNSNKLSCEKIGDYAFSNCQMLNIMQLDLDLLKTIGQGAFYNSSIQVITFMTNFTSDSDEPKFLEQLKDAIHYDAAENPNPLELPEDCQIVVKSKASGRVIGRYDFMFHNLLHSDIDINRNSIVFIDKQRSSIKPLLLVKPINGCLPAITKNEFHASIIGRWK